MGICVNRYHDANGLKVEINDKDTTVVVPGVLIQHGDNLYLYKRDKKEGFVIYREMHLVSRAECENLLQAVSPMTTLQLRR